MVYRREVDGLRAIAVLPVILFHAGIPAFRGGFVGVDVFFVISGYLITSILLAELREGAFSILRFYERRARRILPALFVVMLTCVPVAWLLLPAYDLVSFSKSLAAVSTFSSNLFFWGEGGYFETATELKPLLHTWSLSVEEQYYVFFPPFLMAFWRLRQRRLVILLVALFGISITLAEWASTRRPSAAFFLLPTRGWEILLGAFAAFHLVDRLPVRESRIVDELAGWTGLGLVAFAIFTFTARTPFPGLYALVPTVGTVLIILFASEHTLIGRVLGNPLLVGVGLVSYSAYLWHQPLLAFSRYRVPELGSSEVAGLIAAVFVLATLTWRYVETPLRSKSSLSRRSLFAGASVCGIFFIVLGLLSADVDYAIEETMAKELVTSPAVFTANINERTFVRSRVRYELRSPETVAIGSSRLMQLRTGSTDRALLNLSVSGASVEDIVAIWYLASKTFAPKTVLFGVDPWLLNQNSGQDRWRTLANEYAFGLTEIGKSKVIQKSESHENSSIAVALSALYRSVNLSSARASDDAPSTMDKVRGDGSRVYSVSYSSRTPEQIERDMHTFVGYAMSNYQYSGEYVDVLKALFSAAKPGRRIVLVLSPYHPTLYGLMTRTDSRIASIELEFRRMADQLGIEVIGSYDPSRIGCAKDEFFDGMHPRETCLRKVVDQMTAPTSSSH
ncbi:MAG: acyltransferase [Gemmatimonadaceae bacterium]|nr:acyltransferase [Gemmatimonadaceae bacterium]